MPEDSFREAIKDHLKLKIAEETYLSPDINPAISVSLISNAKSFSIGLVIGIATGVLISSAIRH